VSLPGFGTRVGYTASPERVKFGKESVNLVNTIGPTVPVKPAEADGNSAPPLLYRPLQRHSAMR